jgi:thiamine biosynthesis lipoprotein ApbE
MCWQMLDKKVETLMRAMDVEAKKMRREMSNMEKEVAAMRINRDPARRQSIASGSQSLSGRLVVVFT